VRSFLADLFRLLFKISFFRKRYYGIHKRIFNPLHLFRGVVKRIHLNNTIWFDLHIDDWIQENLFFINEYEAGEMKLMKRFLKPGDVFIDIGANIGLHTLFASAIVSNRGMVFSFEPFSENYNLLQHNISLNNASNVVAERIAVSDLKQQIDIRYDTSHANSGMASAYLPGFSQYETVDSISLDEYLFYHQIERVNFIKIDIEGGEYPALSGMRETLKKFNPIILLEINKEILSFTPYAEKDIIDFLKSMGYTSGGLTDDNIPPLSTHNFLFLKNSLL